MSVVFLCELCVFEHSHTALLPMQTGAPLQCRCVCVCVCVWSGCCFIGMLVGVFDLLCGCQKLLFCWNVICCDLSLPCAISRLRQLPWQMCLLLQPRVTVTLSHT